jgi:hypothetical protein
MAPVAERSGTAEAYRLEVRPDEYWWGGDTADGFQMPFADGYRADLRQPGDNQAMPLLVSSHGRYLWSDSPFIVELSGSALTVRRRVTARWLPSRRSPLQAEWRTPRRCNVHRSAVQPLD